MVTLAIKGNNGVFCHLWVVKWLFIDGWSTIIRTLRLDPGRLKKIILLLCLVPILIFSCDTAVSIYVAVTRTPVEHSEFFVVANNIAPGIEFFAAVFCWFIDADHCDVTHRHTKLAIIGLIVAVTLNIVFPCIIFIICMVLQVFYLRKHLGNSDNPLLKSARDIAVTIYMITALFFFCHIVLYIVLLIFEIFYMKLEWPHKNNKSKVFQEWVLGGIGLLTLPLVNAAVFPFILIFRKDDLRKKYVDGFKQVWCKACRMFRATVTSEGSE